MGQNHHRGQALWLQGPHLHKHHNRVNQETDRARRAAQVTTPVAAVEVARAVANQEVDQVVQRAAQAANPAPAHLVAKKVRKSATTYQWKAQL